jgi:hypothetical protein
VRRRGVHWCVLGRVLGRVLRGILRSVLGVHLCAIVVAVRRHAWLRRVELRALWGPPWPSTRPPPTPTPTEAQLRIILLLEPADVILMLLDGLWLSLAVPRGRGRRSPGRASHHALWADATGEERPAHVQQGECRIFLAVVHRRPRVVRVVVPAGSMVRVQFLILRTTTGARRSAGRYLAAS